MNRNIKHFFALLGSRIVNLALGAFSVWLLARLLGPHKLGEWALISAAAYFLVMLITWTREPFIRFGTEEFAQNGDLSETWGSRIPLLICCATIIYFILITQPFDLLHLFFKLGENVWLALPLMIFSLWVSLDTQATLQTTSKMLTLSFMIVLVSGATVCFYSILYTLGVSWRVEWIVIGTAFISAVLWGSVWLYELFRNTSWPIKPNSATILQTLAYSWPLAPQYLIHYLSEWSDQIFLSVFFSQTEVGLFHISYQIMMAAMALTLPIATITLPKLIQNKILDKSYDEKYLNTIVPTTTVLWAGLIFFAVTILPEVALYILGEAYHEATAFIIILCIGIPGQIFVMLYGALFRQQKRLHVMVTYDAIMLTINIGISLLLLTLIGPIGAAIGTAISYLTYQLLHINGQRHYKVAHTKIVILFTFITIFSLVQAILGPELIFRISWFLASLAILIIISRRFTLVDKDTVGNLFSGKSEVLGSIIRWLFVSKTN